MSEDDTRKPDITTSWRDQAVEFGMHFARHVFDKRGNNTEAHLTESELAAMMAVSFERGAVCATNGAARQDPGERFETVDELLSDLRREPESTVKWSARDAMLLIDMLENRQPHSKKFEEAMAWYQKMKDEQWQQENAEAIRSSNEYVEQHGVPLAKYRMPRTDEEGEHGDE